MNITQEIIDYGLLSELAFLVPNVLVGNAYENFHVRSL